MSTEPVHKDEVAVALQTGRELGPEYEDAVAASLAERLERTIDQRVRAEVAEQVAHAAARPDPAQTPAAQQGPSSAVGVTAFFSLLFAAPMSFALLERAGLPGLIVLWTGIILLNLVVAVAGRRRG
ncbi:hypothetical protein CLV63_102249 [Murinocardiopsis flavida]|uniref:Uncharacterized protein n=1 Tax=Murinocardiopsis flavida TaxID=645275 RepID=A0A2P8DSC9_9ACTN|nr:hypothetical protein [Murinocardiopsis flavida]PSL00123.1 hypothetical protein CLV63_102249 [Murinocardiopsis flavida]